MREIIIENTFKFSEVESQDDLLNYSQNQIQNHVDHLNPKKLT
jgi:hypothetical protein